MPFNKYPVTLRQWYGSSVRIPDYNSSNFAAFVGTCVGLVRTIVSDVLDKEVQVLFVLIDTAAADIENNKIYINSEYLKGDFRHERLNSEFTIAVIMGLIIHEAAHFAWSPATLAPWGDHIERTLPKGMLFERKVAQHLGNIIEDIYIEHEVDRTVPLISWTLDSAANVFFPEEEFAQAQQSTAHITDAPTSGKDLIALLNLLIYAKTREACSGSAYVCELFDMARQATTIRLIEKRMVLAEAIYHKLMAKMTEKAMQESHSSKSLQDAAGIGSFSMSTKEAVDVLSEKARGGTASHEKRKAYPQLDDSSVVKKVNVAVTELAKSRLRLSFDHAGESKTTLIYAERTVPASPAYRIEPDLRYLQLAETARQRASVNRPYGLDKQRGNHIRKLHRIATDQKIFADPLLTTSYQPMDVMIIVDCSGSMVGFMTDIESSKIYKAMQAGIGATMALVNGRCRVAFYGHTADAMQMRGSTTLYRLKGFEDSMFELNERAAALAFGSNSLSRSNNRDGDALFYLSHLFPTQQRQRLMIIISDGQPNAEDYHGTYALDHCKQVVDSIRAQRIEVLSISIERKAVHYNDHIYGKDNNIFNEDPNVIQDIVNRILTK